MLKQKFIIDFAAKFGIQITTAVAGIIVARVAGPEVVGIIAYATSYVSIFLFIIGLFGSAHIKLVSEGQNEADSLTTYSWLLGISSFVYLFIVLGMFLSQKFLMKNGFESIEIENVILIILFSTLISAAYKYSATIFNAKTEQVKANLPELLGTLINNILRVIVVVLGYGAIALAGVKVVGLLIGIPLIVYFLKNKEYGKFRSDLALKYVRIALPLLVVVITNSIMMYSDKLILERIGNIREIGIYTAAFSIGGIFILIGRTAGTVFFPLFSSYFAENNIAEVKRKIKQFERFVFVFILPVIITLALFSYPVMVTLLGIKYEQSAPLFAVLVFSSFFAIWSMPYGNVISGLGLFWLSSLINFMKFMVFLSTLIVLIHPALFDMGAMALALTQLVMNIFLFLAYYIIAYRRIQIQFIKQQLKFGLFWSIIFISTYYFVLPEINSYSVYIQSFIFIPIFLTFVFLLQFLIGLFHKSDLDMLLQIIHPGRMMHYIKQELNK